MKKKKILSFTAVVTLTALCFTIISPTIDQTIKADTANNTHIFLALGGGGKGYREVEFTLGGSYSESVSSFTNLADEYEGESHTFDSPLEIVDEETNPFEKNFDPYSVSSLPTNLGTTEGKTVYDKNDYIPYYVNSRLFNSNEVNEVARIEIENFAERMSSYSTHGPGLKFKPGSSYTTEEHNVTLTADDDGILRPVGDSGGAYYHYNTVIYSNKYGKKFAIMGEPRFGYMHFTDNMNNHITSENGYTEVIFNNQRHDEWGSGFYGCTVEIEEMYYPSYINYRPSPEATVETIPVVGSYFNDNYAQEAPETEKFIASEFYGGYPNLKKLVLPNPSETKSRIISPTFTLVNLSKIEEIENFPTSENLFFGYNWRAGDLIFDVGISPQAAPFAGSFLSMSEENVNKYINSYTTFNKNFNYVLSEKPTGTSNSYDADTGEIVRTVEKYYWTTANEYRALYERARKNIRTLTLGDQVKAIYEYSFDSSIFSYIDASETCGEQLEDGTYERSVHLDNSCLASTNAYEIKYPPIMNMDYPSLKFTKYKSYSEETQMLVRQIILNPLNMNESPYLNSVELPKNASYWNPTYLQCCPSLEAIEIPESVKYVGNSNECRSDYGMGGISVSQGHPLKDGSVVWHVSPIGPIVFYGEDIELINDNTSKTYADDSVNEETYIQNLKNNETADAPMTAPFLFSGQVLLTSENMGGYSSVINRMSYEFNTVDKDETRKVYTYQTQGSDSPISPMDCPACLVANFFRLEDGSVTVAPCIYIYPHDLVIYGYPDGDLERHCIQYYIPFEPLSGRAVPNFELITGYHYYDPVVQENLDLFDIPENFDPEDPEMLENTYFQFGSDLLVFKNTSTCGIRPLSSQYVEIEATGCSETTLEGLNKHFSDYKNIPPEGGTLTVTARIPKSKVPILEEEPEPKTKTIYISNRTDIPIELNKKGKTTLGSRNDYVNVIIKEKNEFANIPEFDISEVNFRIPKNNTDEYIDVEAEATLSEDKTKLHIKLESNSIVTANGFIELYYGARYVARINFDVPDIFLSGNYFEYNNATKSQSTSVEGLTKIDSAVLCSKAGTLLSPYFDIEIDNTEIEPVLTIKLTADPLDYLGDLEYEIKDGLLNASLIINDLYSVEVIIDITTNYSFVISESEDITSWFDNYPNPLNIYESTLTLTRSQYNQITKKSKYIDPYMLIAYIAYNNSWYEKNGQTYNIDANITKLNNALGSPTTANSWLAALGATNLSESEKAIWIVNHLWVGSDYSTTNFRTLKIMYLRDLFATNAGEEAFWFPLANATGTPSPITYSVQADDSRDFDARLFYED